MDVHPIQIKDALELQALRSFLERNKLPYKDIVLQDNLFLLYYDSAGDILGSGGLEIMEMLPCFGRWPCGSRNVVSRLENRS
jgi:hypothetical protein